MSVLSVTCAATWECCMLHGQNVQTVVLVVVEVVVVVVVGMVVVVVVVLLLVAARLYVWCWWQNLSGLQAKWAQVNLLLP